MRRPRRIRRYRTWIHRLFRIESPTYLMVVAAAAEAELILERWDRVMRYAETLQRGRDTQDARALRGD